MDFRMVEIHGIWFVVAMSAIAAERVAAIEKMLREVE